MTTMTLIPIGCLRCRAKTTLLGDLGGGELYLDKPKVIPMKRTSNYTTAKCAVFFFALCVFLLKCCVSFDVVQEQLGQFHS